MKTPLFHDATITHRHQWKSLEELMPAVHEVSAMPEGPEKIDKLAILAEVIWECGHSA